MAKPLGLTKATKNNDNKHPQQHAEWMAGKKIGRPKQLWIYDNGHSWSGMGSGHWEKVR